MESPARKLVGERRWRWTATLLALVVFNIGCSPIIFMNFLLSPFMDDKVEPVCRLAEKDKEVKIVIAAHHANLELSEAKFMHHEVARRLGQVLEQRFKENNEKAKIVPATLVQSYQASQTGYTSPQDIGKHFKADYLILLELDNLSLFEKGSRDQLYRGHAEIQVRVFDMRKPAEEYEKYDKVKRWDYPSVQRYIERSEIGPEQFRSQFVERICKDLARDFTAHPPRERYEPD